jgi:hypothetical protein
MTLTLTRYLGWLSNRLAFDDLVYSGDGEEWMCEK